MVRSLHALFCFSLLFSTPAFSFEMLGLVGYGGSIFSSPPSNYQSSGGGVAYSFLGRIDLGPGQLESGFLYTQTSITNRQLFGSVKTLGSYWIIPLLYRLPVIPPFFSLAIGPDFAILGSNATSIDGSALSGSNDGFKSHFGAEISAEAVQDLGENLSAVMDLRYRHGFGDAISVKNASTSQGLGYRAYVIAIGLQKRLE